MFFVFLFCILVRVCAITPPQPMQTLLYPPHTYWCSPPVNDSYWQRGTFTTISANESHWLQRVLVLSVY